MPEAKNTPVLSVALFLQHTEAAPLDCIKILAIAITTIII